MPPTLLGKAREHQREPCGAPHRHCRQEGDPKPRKSEHQRCNRRRARLFRREMGRMRHAVIAVTVLAADQKIESRQEQKAH